MPTKAILLVDAGNSRVKWGLGEEGKVTGGSPFSSSATDLNRELHSHWGSLPAPAHALISNVAGMENGAILHAWMRQHWGLTPHFVQSNAQACGVQNGYEEPSSLGVDRWVGLIAAHGACKEHLCIADCGTALTLDAIDADGRHLGGVIAPGLSLMRHALGSGTQALRRVSTGRHCVPARNTADGVYSGILQMAAGAIEHFVKIMELRFGTPPRLFLTGGDAPDLGAALTIPYALEPDLILRGLLLIAEGDS